MRDFAKQGSDSAAEWRDRILWRAQLAAIARFRVVAAYHASQKPHNPSPSNCRIQVKFDFNLFGLKPPALAGDFELQYFDSYAISKGAGWRL